MVWNKENPDQLQLFGMEEGISLEYRKCLEEEVKLEFGRACFVALDRGQVCSVTSSNVSPKPKLWMKMAKVGRAQKT